MCSTSEYRTILAILPNEPILLQIALLREHLLIIQNRTVSYQNQELFMMNLVVAFRNSNVISKRHSERVSIEGFVNSSYRFEAKNYSIYMLPVRTVLIYKI